MNKFNVGKLVNSFKALTSKHSPEILTGIGIVSGISSTILAVRATPKAMERIDEKQYELENEREEIVEKVPVLEVIKATWKLYIPAVASGVFAVTCLIGANTVNARRNAALATAYKLSERALVEFKEKTLETIGEQKMEDVKDKVYKERINKTPVKDSTVIISGTGDTLCYDCISGRYFSSSIDKIDRAVNKLNARMFTGSEMYISLNDFYDEINAPQLSHIAVGYELGWAVDRGAIKLTYSPQIVDEDEANGIYANKLCAVIDYEIAPQRDYDRLGR